MIIGGAAIALEYANRHLTRDLDTSTSIQGALLDAVERARKAIQAEDDLDEAPPVGAAGVFDAPEGYEERCRLVRIAGVRHLRVHVPERHDLALMKAARGDERDLAALAAMHRRKPFRLKTLISRYDEMQVHRVARGPALEVRAPRGTPLRRERGEAARAEPQGAHVDGTPAGVRGAAVPDSSRRESNSTTPALQSRFHRWESLATLVKLWKKQCNRRRALAPVCTKSHDFACRLVRRWCAAGGQGSARTDRTHRAPGGRGPAGVDVDGVPALRPRAAPALPRQQRDQDRAVRSGVVLRQSGAGDGR